MRVGKQFEWKQYKILPKYYIRNQKISILLFYEYAL